MKAIFSLLIITVAIWNCEAHFCELIRTNTDVAVVVGECQAEHMPAEFLGPLMECVNRLLDREVSLAEFFNNICGASDGPEMEDCLFEQEDYGRKNEDKLKEGLSNANDCIASRLQPEQDDVSNKVRRSPFAQIVFRRSPDAALKKRSADASLRKRYALFP